MTVKDDEKEGAEEKPLNGVSSQRVLCEVPKCQCPPPQLSPRTAMERNHTWRCRVILTFHSSGVHKPTVKAPQSVFLCNSREQSFLSPSDGLGLWQQGSHSCLYHHVMVSPPLSCGLPSMQLISWPFLLSIITLPFDTHILPCLIRIFQPENPKLKGRHRRKGLWIR